MVKFLSMVWTAVLVVGFTWGANAQVVDRIVAVVNNEIILLSELNKAVYPYRKNIEASDESLDRQQAMIADVQGKMLQQLVDRSLTFQEAKRYQIEVNDSEVDNAIKNFKKANGLDDAGLKKGLASEGMTLDEYRDGIREQMLQSRLINRAVRAKVIITDAEIQAYYKAHEADFSGSRKYRLRNIMTATEKEMAAVLAKLSAKASFADLARQYSIGSNASEGGDLGLFDLNSFSQEISDHIRGLKTGEHTGIIPAGGAFQIIQVADITMEGNMTMDQAQDKIRDILYKERAEKQFKQWISDLKKNAHIKLML